jgi:integral membrane protein
MLMYFRAISMLEGLSYLAILGVTLGVISRDFVASIGMGHGVLFILYILLSQLVSEKQGWSFKTSLPLLLASIVPFAFILVELFLRRTLDAQEVAEI